MVTIYTESDQLRLVIRNPLNGLKFPFEDGIFDIIDEEGEAIFRLSSTEEHGFTILATESCPKLDVNTGLPSDFLSRKWDDD